MRGRALWGVLVVGAVALAASIGVLQVMGQRQAAERKAAFAAAASCSPAPCVDAGGYRMHVDSVDRSGKLVRVRVSFAVRGRQQMHAVPDDFSIYEASGRHDRPVFSPDGGCPRWPRTDISDGGTLGPETLCFQTSADGKPLHLRWSPDLGISEYFSSGYDVPI